MVQKRTVGLKRVPYITRYSVATHLKGLVGNLVTRLWWDLCGKLQKSDSIWSVVGKSLCFWL